MDFGGRVSSCFSNIDRSWSTLSPSTFSHFVTFGAGEGCLMLVFRLQFLSFKRLIFLDVELREYQTA